MPATLTNENRPIGWSLDLTCKTEHGPEHGRSSRCSPLTFSKINPVYYFLYISSLYEVYRLYNVVQS